MHKGRNEAMKFSWAASVATVALASGLVMKSVIRPRYSFRNKSVVITGGSRGLGLELARLFGKEGANVVIVGRDIATLQSSVAELERHRISVLDIPCDVRIQNDVETVINTVIDRYGAIDVLVNNAGVIQVGPFDQMTIEDYQNAMATHAWGTLYSSLAAVPFMRKQRCGRIVNVCSIGGKLGVPHLAPYVMSKFAQAGLSEALATELFADGIVVTTVYPGLMRTGSHVNACFKGNNRQEFAWFSLSAGLPIVSINSERAARQIVEGCRRGSKQVIITPAAKIAVLAHAVFPGLVSRGMQLMNSLLPHSGGRSQLKARSGWDSSSRLSPSFLTRLADRAVERNNERLARE